MNATRFIYNFFLSNDWDIMSILAQFSRLQVIQYNIELHAEAAKQLNDKGITLPSGLQRTQQGRFEAGSRHKNKRSTWMHAPTNANT